MKLIDELIAAINNIRKQIEEVEEEQKVVRGYFKWREKEEELKSLHRKLRFAAQDLEKAASYEEE